MQEFKQIFEDYGADYKTTMSRFMGNEKMYMRFLDMLFKDDNLHKLGDSISSGDMDSAFEAAHTLKGVVGNMGLTPLFDAVCAIVEPLRRKEEHADYSAMYEVIRKEFENADGLREHLKEVE